MIDSAALRRRARPVDRSSDRLVALSVIAIAVAFLVAAIVSAFLPAGSRRGAWLPLHLALAGGATTAIAGVMPFFSAAFAAAPPSDARLRLVAVLAVAAGALGVSGGVMLAAGPLATGGGLLFIAGILLTGLAATMPLREALGPSRGIVVRGYVGALAMVGFGAAIATLFEAGWPPIVTGWGGNKPAHAWLNLIGFVSLVIGTTLLHFFPTIVGARIVVRRSARLTVWGLGAGAPLVAAGLIAGSDPLAWVGAAAVAVGAASMAAYAASVWRAKARWTTDPGWHRFAMLGMVSALAWFEVGIAIAVGRLVVFGATPASWSLEAVIAPLVAGWVGLAVLASATHLIPAIGPGDPLAHARQRALLGRVALVRLVGANAGTAALAFGLAGGNEALSVTGAVLIALVLATTAGLLAAAIRVGLVSAAR
jgi:hypothetical protein